MKKFVIVGTQRTGSSALAEALGMHPGVACGWEWSLRVPWRRKLSAPARALEGDFSLLCAQERAHMEAIFSPRIEWIGYRSLFSSSDKWLFTPGFNIALLSDRFGDHLRWFARQPDLHIIHIIRRDNVDWLKSKYASRATNAYVGTEYPEGLKVTIPIRSSIRRLQTKNWIDQNLAGLARSNHYFKVEYEHFLEDRVTVMADALQFLGLDVNSVADAGAKVLRQSTGDAAHYILNYVALHRALEEHGLLKSLA